MKRSKHLLLAASFAFTAMLSQAAVITVTGPITSNTTWVNTNKYILSGWVYVKNNASLTIPAGTLIVGEKATKGALIIERGSKLFAQGTANQPIVFTSAQPVGTRTYGDWGGVIILGNAPINTPAGTAVIEGGIPAADGTYGGNIPADNSGIISYVRIEFAGIAFLPNSEINGLTLGGVGSGTQIDHVQVSYSGDDSFEFFGGSVSASYLVAYRGLDDDFDTDFGHSGRLQFGVSLRDSSVADISGSNGIETDNDGTGSNQNPRTRTIFSNFTLVGPLKDNTTIGNSLFKRGSHLRRNTETSIYNTIEMGWPIGLFIDGTTTQLNACNDTLQYRNNIISGNILNFESTWLSVCGGQTPSTWVTVQEPGNSILTTTGNVQLADPFNYLNPNFLPLAGSPALSGSDFSNARLSGLSATSYRGAFGTNDWTNCWTNWDPNNTNYTYPINNGPSVTITVSGTTSFCDSIELVAAASGANAYQWFKNNVAISGANAIDYWAKTSGSYFCQVSNASGCTKNSTSKSLSKKTNPAAPKAYFSCFTGANRLYSTYSATYVAYQWYLNGTVINGASFPSVTPVIPGNYTVRVTGASGCSAASSARVYPAATLATTQLISTNCSKRNYSLATGVAKATKVAGTNQYEFTFIDSLSNSVSKYISNNSATCSLNVVSPALAVGSTYYVKVRVITASKDTSCFGNTCTIKISAALANGSSRINNEEAITAISFFPNPATDKVTFEFETLTNAAVKITLLDVTGREVAAVYSNKVDAGVNTIDFSTTDLNKGVYFVRMMIDGQIVSTEKLSVIK